ncbi:B12-binding domain-containing radical SAM protein [Candidatus Shapirobacteria bacterium]|jgi:radical SAM superfamily enzyme YgiQ (UPF0313 family)|nr:B12-binding domain-containing radical SAM protein [Candidatus Shapirobacteria bacterium]
MRILLVDPPFQRFVGFYRFYFPLGLTYLAAVLQNEGHEVLIYDAEHDSKCISLSTKDLSLQHNLYKNALEDDSNSIWLEYKNILKQFDPDIVGISVLSVKLKSAIKIAQITKSYKDSIYIVAGGEHVTARPNDVLDNFFDFVVCGEGESGILDVVEQVKNKKIVERVLKPVLIQDLDMIPMPLIDSLLDVKSYRPIDLGLMMTARGCPYNCTFCGLSPIWGHRVRSHSLKRIISEIKLRILNYNVDYFSFRNGTFTVNRNWVIDFCNELIANSINIQWECLTRVNVIDEELIEKMIKAGCVTIRIGVESGSPKILEYMGKDITLDQVRKAARILNNSGIFWSAYFMLGVPQETLDTMDETFRFMKEINPPFVTLSKFTPLPGTEMYDDVVRLGLLNPDTTDWLWGANQSIDEVSFVKYMSQDEFSDKMYEIAQYIQKYNKAHLMKDARMKKD